MEEFMNVLKKKATVGLVGGSDLTKILEQLGGDDGKIQGVGWGGVFKLFFFTEFYYEKL